MTMQSTLSAIESAPLLRHNGDDLGAQKHPHPRTINRIITRIQALTLELLPIQVDLDELMSPVSSIITREVVDAYAKIGGDFHHCVPFALLEARRYFRLAAYTNPSDSDENEGRKLACEVLARKIVARTPMADQYALLSARYSIVESDGDESIPISALESAVDQRATFFLSSGEAQRCVFALWRGLLVQRVKEDGSIEYTPYEGAKHMGGFWAHFNPSRVGVPRYQFFFRITLWLLFIVAYSVAIQTPDREFGVEDYVLYIQLLGYVIEDVTKIWKIGLWSATSFWTVVNGMIYSLLGVAFVYRILDLHSHDVERSAGYRILSFQFLSSASPLIWMKLLTIFDLFQYFGTLQVCPILFAGAYLVSHSLCPQQIVVWRMLKESAVFFTLLGLLAIGFGQALTGLDLTPEDDSTETVIHSLIQGLLGSPAFEAYARGASSYPFGMILYYLWSILTLVILLNILVALFGSAYNECTEEAVPTFMAFFASKTIASIRAPDTYVYAAPFNLIEILILPLELILSTETYASINRYLMGTIFCVPMHVSPSSYLYLTSLTLSHTSSACIALFESQFDHRRLQDFASLTEEPDEYAAADEDPEPYTQSDDIGEGDADGKKICIVSFAELKKALPSLTRSVQGEILWEIAMGVSRQSAVYYPASPQFALDIEIKIIGSTRTAFAVMSGGHASNPGWSSVGSEGVHISMARLREITLSADNKTVAVGPGNTWDAVNGYLDQSNVAVVGGRVPGVGVGGFILGGGGFSCRSIYIKSLPVSLEAEAKNAGVSNTYGMTIDTVISFTLVLPNGTITTVDASRPDLFFALKGAGNKLGIVTQFVLETYPSTEINGGLKVFALGQVGALADAMASFQTTNRDPKAQRFAEFLEGTPSNLSSGLRGSFQTISISRLSKPFMDQVLNQSTYYNNIGPLFTGFFFSYNVQTFLVDSYFANATDSAFPRDAKDPWMPVDIYFSWLLAGDDLFFYQALKDTAAILEATANANGDDTTSKPLYPNYALADTPVEKMFGENLPRLKRIVKEHDPANVMGLAGGFSLQ
ncbi:hypothetical protein RQP46_007946 [Phenoliferia psychrophenolica]